MEVEDRGQEQDVPCCFLSSELVNVHTLSRSQRKQLFVVVVVVAGCRCVMLVGRSLEGLLYMLATVQSGRESDLLLM